MTPDQPKPNTPSVREIEHDLLQRNPSLFEGISNTKKNKLLHSFKDLITTVEVHEYSQSRSFSGPIPPPDILKEYIQISPDFAQSIVQMAIDEQKYAHSRDDKIISKSFETKRRGQVFALIVALTAIIGGVACILLDHEISGSIITGVGLTGLVAEFLGKTKQKEAKE